ncbi:hypothetical protein [Kitasatospora sp. NPDC127116]|uniref:hypothetical protein n=1 Tax=Kitasatospora sp. NPDC127116 TaxID=3345367 RepID=UPI003634785E
MTIGPAHTTLTGDVARPSSTRAWTSSCMWRTSIVSPASPKSIRLYRAFSSPSCLRWVASPCTTVSRGIVTGLPSAWTRSRNEQYVQAMLHWSVRDNWACGYASR